VAEPFSLGSPLWLAIVAVMLVVVIVLFLRGGRRVFSRDASERFEVTEIPPDVAGAREFIVRDDQTGSRMQFVVLGEHARIVLVHVPARHLGTGVEAEMFQAAVGTTSAFIDGAPESWTWPPVDGSAAAEIAAYARTVPELAIYDAQGNRYW